MTTTQGSFWLNAVTAIQTELPTVQVLPGPPGENEDPRECVYFEDLESEFEWRSLGTGTQLLSNRTESLQVTVIARVTREASSHLTAFTDANSRMDEIVEAIELAIAQEPTIGGAANVAARVSSVRRTPTPVQSGWSITATLDITGTNYPGS
jgi:hypothetical protein